MFCHFLHLLFLAEVDGSRDLVNDLVPATTQHQPLVQKLIIFFHKMKKKNIITAMQSAISGDARPFLKWAGGKTQLIEQIDAYLPDAVKKNGIKCYYEPFLGGGAVFFHIIQKYAVAKAVLADINRELMLVYKVIRQDVTALIDSLECYSKKYTGLDEPARTRYYYQIREQLNLQRYSIDYHQYAAAWILRAAQLIFLNKTGYNGLFRLNKLGGFNVPFGRYKNPRILDAENLKKVSALLQKVELTSADFSFLLKEKGNNSFVYFDPPYRPISKTAGFTSYSSSAFGDNEQIRLAAVFKELDKKGYYLMLSNSDPKNVVPGDDFFDRLYEGFNIYRVTANRMINSQAEKRGKIREILITNY
jgi:DNA adenine methylase